MFTHRMTINGTVGIIRNAQGNIVEYPPIDISEERAREEYPEFYEYLAWIEAGNIPEEVYE